MPEVTQLRKSEVQGKKHARAKKKKGKPLPSADHTVDRL
jgi:hypothetical protein